MSVRHSTRGSATSNVQRQLLVELLVGSPEALAQGVEGVVDLVRVGVRERVRMVEFVERAVVVGDAEVLVVLLGGLVSGSGQ